MNPNLFVKEERGIREKGRRVEKNFKIDHILIFCFVLLYHSNEWLSDLIEWFIKFSFTFIVTHGNISSLFS